MAFRCRQKMSIELPSYGMNSVAVVNETTGLVERVKQPLNKVLPSPELFDPKACIKAGVNLEKLNTKVLGITPDSFEAAPDVAGAASETEPPTEEG